MSVIFTVGYEGTDIDRFISTLKAVGIRQLADVRAVALSRKKGFSKSKLAERLNAEGIKYIHFIGLGDPKPGREAARAGRYDEFVSIYSKHISTEEAQKDVEKLASLTLEAPTVLLCFERDPRTCHRSMVAAAVEKVNGSPSFDLYADDPSRYIRNAEKLPKFMGALAAE